MQRNKMMGFRRATTSRRAVRSRRGATTAGSSGDQGDPFVIAGYQQHIADLEVTVSHLRHRLTELTASVSELREARGRLSDLFQNAPVGYVVHDASGAILEINRTARAMLGLEKASTSIPLAKFIRPGQLRLWAAHIKKAETSLRTATELVLQGEGGKLIPVEFVTLVFRSCPKLYRTVLTDISQRRAAEAALAQTQHYYHRLIDTIEGIVWEADAHTFDVIFVSRYAERLLGYNLDHWMRPGFFENRIYIEDREHVANAIARAVETRQPLCIDYRVTAADRRIVWLRDNITPVERDGRLNLLGVAVDATEQHDTHERLRRNQESLELRVAERTAELRMSVQELEAFSYSVSHDLRAPLRAVLGFAEIALGDGEIPLAAHVKDALERIIQTGLRADRLVQDVLAYSRVSRANFQLVPVDLERFVPELIAQYPEFQPPKTSVQLGSPLLAVMAHEALLAQCVTNLLSNAVKFVSNGAKPSVKIWSELVSNGQMVRFWVEDNGIGIEPQDIGRIFNIFERVHSEQSYAGTGIGLAIVRKAVERMGGGVGVQSTAGKGSRFWIELKAA